MGNKILYRKCILFVSFILFSTVSLLGKNLEVLLPEPEFRLGSAVVEGLVNNLISGDNVNGLTIRVQYMNMVTEEEMKFETKANSSGQFYLEIPLERSVLLAGLNISSEKNDYGWCSIGLSQYEVLNVDITIVDSMNFKITSRGGLDLSEYDMKNINTAFERFLDYFTWDDYYKMTPEEFSRKTLQEELYKRLQFAIDTFTFYKKIMYFVKSILTIEYIKGRVFQYKESAEQSFESVEINPYYADYTAIEPGVSYYSFLKDLNLNNPQYLYCRSFSDFLRHFLSIHAFKIPRIGDTEVDTWLNGVKSTVKDVLGFDSGLFYDLLAAKALCMQLTENKIPFSNIQLETIKKYFGANNPELLKLLMNENDGLVRILDCNKNLKICELPGVTKEALMDSILARYKGQVVLIDFWATWCAPCMQAHKEMRLMKGKFTSKGVKFVYMTDESSPKALWNSKIQEIGGDHYYISTDTWEYILDHFGFTGIPTYMIYDQDGKLIQSFTGFPGTDKMRVMMEELLH